MAKIDTVIFDLDGTLLDTLDDLTASVNAALTGNGLPPRTKAEVCAFVGNGIKKLMQLAVEGGEQNPIWEKCFADFKAHYAAHCAEKTKPYPGIVPLLTRLKEHGYRLGVVSNKFDPAVKSLNERYFAGLIPVAIGAREDVRKKPAPDAVLAALTQLGSGKETAVYVGDSDVDILTARNVGTPCISVCWGFRDKAFLLANGAEILIDDAEELLEFLEKVE